MSNAWKLDRMQGAVLVPFSIAALVSLITGIRHAIEYRCHDLQWMGVRLVGQGIDPWQEELAHFPHHYDHFVTPNYLHSLYLLLFPYGRLVDHLHAHASIALQPEPLPHPVGALPALDEFSLPRHAGGWPDVIL